MRHLEKFLSLKVLPRVFRHHRFAIPFATSLFFLKKSPHFLLCPSYLSSLSPRSKGPCHKLSDNQSILSLSPSSFVLLPEKASCLSINGPLYRLNSFCIFSPLLVISLCSLGNHRLHQQLCLSTVPMSREVM